MLNSNLSILDKVVLNYFPSIFPDLWTLPPNSARETLTDPDLRPYILQKRSRIIKYHTWEMSFIATFGYQLSRRRKKYGA